ncbi:MAG: response regulator transcription factor [Acidobacteria bacterium]|nr:response regulator transcription factor [Acidobacteriota bacterium]MBV9067482.1 response regulator transcription factor [Acidobacteriota bacterium]MBV9187878.1 response regulator transcription factor [Acidobacteriota bacterium]
MIRVLIADDHDIVREGVKQIVSETSDITVGGEARTGAEALDRAREGGWDVVILDLNLPDRPGLDVLAQLRAVNSDVPVLILSMHGEASYAARALKAGASGYVSKSTAREHLVIAIRKLANGERFLTPELAESLAFGMMGARSTGHQSLSDREFQVLCLIAAGRPPREIATELNVSVKTVATHRARLLQKMGLRNNAELVRYAIDHQLLPAR